MTRVAAAPVAAPTRQERIGTLMDQLRPKVEEALRRMVERAVDVPEAEEFGAIEYEFRDFAAVLWARTRRRVRPGPAKPRGSSTSKEARRC